MDVYIGAMGQNKKEIAILNYQLIYGETDKNWIFADCDTMEARTGQKEYHPGEIFRSWDPAGILVLNHFHRMVYKNLCMLQREDYRSLWLEEFISEMAQRRGIIIGDEIGCGVIPLGEEERQYRALYGRIMCELCQKAERVTRIVCGICQVIKE